MDQLKNEAILKEYPLPDFWLLQLKYSIERPLHHQLVCKHEHIKPYLSSKMEHPQLVSEAVYEDLVSFYKGKQFKNLVCPDCCDEVEQLIVRKKK